MRLYDLQLDDFGCFRNAQMQDVDDGLIVVGGPQRAGKTTFMQVVRQLGWGIKQDGSVPPATDEYRLYAQFATADERHIVNLDGYAAPDTAPLDGSPKRSIEELFGEISRVQYEQLFTISLSELQRLPPGIDDEEALSEVLLGGAYGDIADIPALEEEFGDRAHDIGRSYGKPTKRSELRGPMDTIEEGIELRDRAKAQVAKHREKSAELDELRDAISGLENERSSRERARKRFSVVAAEFDDVRRYQELRRSLSDADIEKAESFPSNGVERAERLLDEYAEVRTDQRDAEEAFDAVSDADDSDEQCTRLLDAEETIERARENISGWRERLEQIQAETQDLESKKTALANRIAALHPDWGGDRSEVTQVETDLLSSERVADVVATFQRASERVEATEAKLRSTRDQLASAETRLAELEDQSTTATDNGVVRTFAVLAAVAIVGGIGAGVLGFPFVGLLITTLLFVLGLFYVSQRLSETDQDESPVREARATVNSLETDIEGLESELAEYRDTKENAAAELANVRKTLGLPADVSPDGIESFYEEVVELNSDVADIEQTEASLAKKRAELETDLRDVADVVSDVQTFTWRDDEPLTHAESLFSAIRSASTEVSRAKALVNGAEERARKEDEIRSLLDEWDGIDSIPGDDPDADTITARLQTFIDDGNQARTLRERREEMETLRTRLRNRFETQAVEAAFAPVREDDDTTWLDALERVADDYVDQEAIETQRDRLATEIDSLEEEIQEKQKEAIELQRELEQLASDDELVEARETITDGQRELQRLGEEYAVNRIAETLTGKLHERFIEEVAGSLIEDAGEIFRQITTEYDGIDHTDELDDLRFKALRDGKPPHDSGELSRATAEQLFLAIRIARIRQLDVTLPVILDDSIANFDPDHSARLFRTVDELAETHQVFLLTCHPEQVALAGRHADVSQYWCLDDGRFEGPHDQNTSLLELLTRDSGPVTVDGRRGGETPSVTGE